MTSLFQSLILLLSFITFSGAFKVNNPVLVAPFNKHISLHSTKENKESIPWSGDRKLTWDDFLCAPQHNTDAVASTSTALGFAYQINRTGLTYQITCNFSKEQSWALVKTDYILTHEQAHFDITELYARKLHQALQEYTFNPRTFKSDLNTIYQQVVAEKEKMQEDYDEETDHSRKKKIQYQWFDKVNAMLQASEPFADYP